MSGQRGPLNRPNGWSKQTPPRGQDPYYLARIMSMSALDQQLRLQDQAGNGQMRSTKAGRIVPPPPGLTALAGRFSKMTPAAIANRSTDLSPAKISESGRMGSIWDSFGARGCQRTLSANAPSVVEEPTESNLFKGACPTLSEALHDCGELKHVLGVRKPLTKADVPRSA
jgi:hypothetical protein